MQNITLLGKVSVTPKNHENVTPNLLGLAVTRITTTLMDDGFFPMFVQRSVILDPMDSMARGVQRYVIRTDEIHINIIRVCKNECP